MAKTKKECTNCEYFRMCKGNFSADCPIEKAAVEIMEVQAGDKTLTQSMNEMILETRKALADAIADLEAYKGRNEPCPRF